MSDLPYKEQGARLAKLRRTLRLSQIELSEILGIQQGTISNAERGRHLLGKQSLQLLCDKYSINIDYYMTGLGEAFDKNLSNPLNIYANVPVSAGMLDKNYITDRPSIENLHLPIKFPFPTVTLPISGDSMTPRLRDGDFVICRKLESATEIKDGQLYVIQTKRDGMTCKFLSKEDEVLRLWSANPIYKPFALAFDDVLALYEVLLKIAKA